MRRARKYPEDDKVYAYMPDVARELGVSVSGHNAFRTVRNYAERYLVETGQCIEVSSNDYFTCVIWEQLRPFAQWYLERQALLAGKPPVQDGQVVAVSIPQFTGFMRDRVLAASTTFAEHMIELGRPEAAFLFFEQPEGRGFSTGNIRFEGEHED